jgi:hypothetical protein
MKFLDTSSLEMYMELIYPIIMSFMEIKDWWRAVNAFCCLMSDRKFTSQAIAIICTYAA